MAKIRKAVNWNKPDHQFYDDLYVKQTQQFWLPEEIPVSEDKSYSYEPRAQSETEMHSDKLPEYLKPAVRH